MRYYASFICDPPEVVQPCSKPLGINPLLSSSISVCPFLHTSIFQCSSSFTGAKIVIIPRFSAIKSVKYHLLRYDLFPRSASIWIWNDGNPASARAYARNYTRNDARDKL